MLEVPFSYGDVLDRVTILELKAARVAGAERQANVARELALLRARWEAAGLPQPPEAAALRAVNTALWEVEDALRRLEAAGDFGPDFVALARRVYHLNDERAALKRAVNLRLGSGLIEEKQYVAYGR